MGPGTDVWPHCTSLDNGYSRECMPAMIEDEEPDDDLDNVTQPNYAKPPRNGPPVRHSISEALLVDTSNLKLQDKISGPDSPQDLSSASLPAFRSGSCSEIGPKPYMEDEFICVDDLQEHLDAKLDLPLTGAFYGVFDGHGGVDAASFTKRNILEFIVEDSNFPNGVKKAVKNAFVKADHALADTSSLDNSSGTTALTVLILGRNMIIANAGDSRAVLGKRGRAIELSIDHKPSSTSEKKRIEKLGGVIYDGYLNGQLSVARALGDWHMKGPKGSACPLSAEPELKEVTLTKEDEFLILGCDGLWDVMSSQYAVTIVRKELMVHNDPGKCSRELVSEALKRNSCDNLTVVVVCFSSEPPPKIEVPKSEKRRTISVEGLDVLKGVLHHI
ncbi:probable protein phosphatase 2C 47 isoform X2 [Cynara cardunculus var. scolymus]|uniref:probable protein phosphatase 2C 47 isoform X2 n=1 Tax=Cynara cardunculus var. scolymus TaxID=59895 RepID=UPI000D624685|nr:probable protein phosphatase 2C 47 isoform X2 [Cynara cardunculus var. scolymus]